MQIMKAGVDLAKNGLRKLGFAQNNGGTIINAETGLVEQTPRSVCRRPLTPFAAFCLFVGVCCMFLGISVPAWAQSNSFPDPSTIYTGLATPFNAALSWVIGAIAVLTLLGWILVAVRRRK